MTRYIAFLGSINVGKNRLLMVDLREALEREDFADIETVAASGNVLFSHPESPAGGLAEKMAWVVREEFDIASEIIVLARDELAQAIADNPFAQRDTLGAESQVHTVFFSGQPSDEDFAQLVRDYEGRGPELIALGTRALHVDYNNGVGRSPLTNNFIAKRLGFNGTARNMKSMKRVLAKLDELERGEEAGNG